MLFSDPIPGMLAKLLDFYSQRQTLISANLSNVDTPGYRAKDVTFEGQLKSAMGKQDSVKMKVTNPKHIDPGTPNLKNLNPKLIEEPPINARPDKNTVDLDNEMKKLAETQLMYDAGITMLKKKGGMLKYVVMDGKI